MTNLPIRSADGVYRSDPLAAERVRDSLGTVETVVRRALTEIHYAQVEAGEDEEKWDSALSEIRRGLIDLGYAYMVLHGAMGNAERAKNYDECAKEPGATAVSS